MEVDGALQGGSTRPRRRRLNVLLAGLVIAAILELLVWASPSRGGVGTQYANAGAGSEVLHDRS
jgi:ferric-dicitrate binding protein FerR (iron transport regulator)